MVLLISPLAVKVIGVKFAEHYNYVFLSFTSKAQDWAILRVKACMFDIIFGRERKVVEFFSGRTRRLGIF